MSSSRALSDARTVEKLALSLAEIPAVRKLDSPTEPQSSTLAHALGDIEESCTTLVTDRIPELLQALGDPGRMQETLVEIGEELAHILYHVRDTEYYRYVVDRVESSSR
jgi:hypothetical protein